MFSPISHETINLFSGSSLLPVIEFTSISIVVIATYLGVHAAFTRIKPANKVLISMFMGVTAYSLGKLVLVFLLTGPLFNAY